MGATVHHFYMRKFWVGSSIILRCIAKSITVPLLMIKFYLILSATPGNRVHVGGWAIISFEISVGDNVAGEPLHGVHQSDHHVSE